MDFLQLLEAGLAVRKRAPVNWCPECKTVLANEQVIGGICERHPGIAVELRFLEQWFFKITEYAERLLANHEWLDWSDSTRTMQVNWIGRSEGAELLFETPDGLSIPVFTTRPDTVFGATYVVVAPEHPLVDGLTSIEQRIEVNTYRREAAAMDLVSRRVGEKEKTGVFTGSYARNPASGDAVPVWVADYVLMEYGTGAIMAVPAHDERDLDFARKYGLEVKQVVERDDPNEEGVGFAGWNGMLVNSGKFDGISCREAAPAITAWLEGQHAGVKKVQYRLHDWCISRQRYWGRYPSSTATRAGSFPSPRATFRCCFRRSRISGRMRVESRRWRGPRTGTVFPARSAVGARTARRTCPTRSSIPPGTSCAIPRRSSTPGLSIRSSPTSGSRSTRTSAAMSTPSSI